MHLSYLNLFPAEVYPKMYHTCFFLVTYMAPLCLMVLAYLQIFRKLWCRQVSHLALALFTCSCNFVQIPMYNLFLYKPHVVT